jgi:hypothetical protein
MLLNCEMQNFSNLSSIMIFLVLLLFVMFITIICRGTFSFSGGVTLSRSDTDNIQLLRRAMFFLISIASDRFFVHQGEKYLLSIKKLNKFYADLNFQPIS